MKKRGVIVLLVSILALSLCPLVIAEVDDDLKIENAYLWLIDQSDAKWQNLDSETNALALMALGYDDRLAVDGRNALLDKQDEEEACWPARRCRSKETAFSILALNALGESVEEETDWLLERETTFTGSNLNWLLQVDSSEPANCSIVYDSKEYNLEINEDKTYSWGGSSPSCLSLVDIVGSQIIQGKYWIKISKGCLDNIYTISCDVPASVSIPYMSSSLYISPETFETPTDVAIEAVCIKEGASCNYESTMWGTYALYQADREYTHFLPYLIGESGNNQHLLPDSILWLLTGKEDHANSLLSKQNRIGYWSQVRGKGKYWDTSLGILGLFDYATDNVTKAQDWLLKNQNNDGSFGTTKKIRDTAMALYSSWPKIVSGGINDCEDVYNYFCRTDCLSEEEEKASISCAVGVCCKSSGLADCSDTEDCSKSECKGEFVTDIFGRRGQCEVAENTCDDEFDNDGDDLIDMDDNDCTLTCFELGGEECDYDEECDVNTRKTLESDRCCVGSCIPSQVICSEQSGIFCSNNQKCDGNIVSASDASASSFCCQGDCKGKASFWIWLFIILIVVAGALIFLYKKGLLDKYMDKLSKTFKKEPPKSGGKVSYRPPVKPYTQAGPPTPVRPFSYQRHHPRPTPQRKSSTKTDTDLQKTIDKLRKYASK
ncbi:hypothetical protein ACFLZZ_02975 [Nanoarchaeota archaeon]